MEFSSHGPYPLNVWSMLLIYGRFYLYSCPLTDYLQPLSHPSTVASLAVSYFYFHANCFSGLLMELQKNSSLIERKASCTYLR
ncbi:hypothetical protein E2C01_010089 [Portunus trituberculatus]|uniref:Uncharacterized protein n=1 Tax=Portunus trituberculatus TaxID=210409 RepID=A0A5B7D7F9_PORTR|nr:hypothetical protein [Portunus trituberculatus]